MDPGDGPGREGSPSVQHALVTRGISKRFGTVSALRDVDLDVEVGEIHALLGENGAGKTTLMNIACGMFPADTGELRYFGQRARPTTPAAAANLGIGMVHQHFRLVEPFTVAENLHLGWPQAPQLLSAKSMQRRAAELAERYRISIDPKARVWQLSVAEKQRVAILKALSRGARILVLDKPTAVLTPQEAGILFENLRALRATGRAVILISHKLREVLAVSDRISVLRGGVRAATVEAAQADTDSLIRLMLGDRKAGDLAANGAGVERALDAHRAIDVGRSVAKLTRVSATDDRGLVALDQVSLALAPGELVGVASVAGNGAHEFVEVLTGLREPQAGTVSVVAGGKKGRGTTARRIGHIPEETSTGVAMDEAIGTNAVLRLADTSTGVRWGAFMRERTLEAHARSLMSAASLRHISHRRTASTLSGGQCQRLIVQRELAAGRPVLVAAYPSRGLDVASAAEVQRSLVSARNDGTAVLLLSEDLDEIFELSDRILVIYEGRIVADLDPDATTREEVGLWMTGGADAASGVDEESS